MPLYPVVVFMCFAIWESDVLSPPEALWQITPLSAWGAVRNNRIRRYLQSTSLAIASSLRGS
jgi:hypothetical protein